MITVWECKIGSLMETTEIPPQFDALARAMLEALYEGMVGDPEYFCFSSWDGVLTETQRKIMHDRYPDTAEYQ